MLFFAWVPTGEIHRAGSPLTQSILESSPKGEGEVQQERGKSGEALDVIQKSLTPLSANIRARHLPK